MDSEEAPNDSRWDVQTVLQGPDVDPSSRLVILEALRRGLHVDVFDRRARSYRLAHGSRSVRCTESLSELTPPEAVARCDDKRATAQLLAEAGLRVPAEVCAATSRENAAFLRAYHSVVVKPVHGEQGRGVSVGLCNARELEEAIAEARQIDPQVVIQERVWGEDVRLIVIDGELVAAAVRRPPRVHGDGRRTLRSLIEAESLLRQRESNGHSGIPIDEETRRVVGRSGYALDAVLPAGVALDVRAAANLHTGGTMHDVTDELHPMFKEVARTAAEALQIPVTGLDLMLPDLHGTRYSIIEANERPGLANHGHRPIARRFVDYLFPRHTT